MAKNTTVEQWEDFRYEVVPLENLFVDKEYQRRPTGIVQEIRRECIPALLPTLCVSARKECKQGNRMVVTSGAVFDGQNRLQGAREHNEAIDAKEEVVGPRVQRIPCIVYSGLSQAQEAQLFVWIQTRRRNVQPFDKFRASLVAGDEETMIVKELVEGVGYELGYKGMSAASITAIGTVTQMYRRDPMSMERSLFIFHEAWGERHVPSGTQLSGMARFLRENPEVDDEKLIRRIFITSPTELDKKELNARELAGGKRSQLTMASAIQSVYGIRESQVETRTARLKNVA